MANPDSMVYVVQGDARERETLADQLLSCGLYVRTFGSATQYLHSITPNVPSCLVLDTVLPDINGLDLQRRLARGAHPGIVFITECGDVQSAVRAMKAGAIDFLTRPYSREALLRAVEAALAQDRQRRRTESELTELRRRYALLTPRERDVLPLIAGGLLNKQAAAQLGIRDVTVQVHRCRIMHKMEAASFSKLVRISIKLGISLDDVDVPATTWHKSASQLGMNRRDANRSVMIVSRRTGTRSITGSA